MTAIRRTLDDVIASDDPGFACSKSKLVKEGLIHLRPFNITSDGALSLVDVYRIPLTDAPANKRVLEEGDILFNNTNSVELVGKAALVGRRIEAGFSNHLTRIRVDGGKVVPQWLALWLRWKRGTGQFSAHATRWVGQAAFKTSELRRMEVVLPSLTEQRRLVDILSRAEGIVRLRHEAQKKAAELIPALFLDMFGDPATNPKGWPIRPLSELVTFVSGGTPSKARDDYWVGTLPWVSPKDMKIMDISDSIDHISSKVLTETNMKLVPAGAILIVVRGMILIHSVPVAHASVPLTINQDMKALLPRPGITPLYLLWLLRVMQLQLLNMVSTAAHGTRKLDTERIGAIGVPLPPMALQDTFARRCEGLSSIRSQQESATVKAMETFDGLLSGTFVAQANG